MRFLVTEKLGPHKFKTPEGYLICTDAILSRTGKQEYKRCELFGDACEDPDKIVNVERTDDEVFSDKAMASFENKAVCIEHPDHDVNAENHNELAVGFVRDIHKGEDNGKPVMMGTLVITDKDAVEAVESGEYKELSCGYDCDIDDDGEPRQRNIRGNHVALCKQGRAGIARIVDSVDNKPNIKALGKWEWDEVMNDWYDTGRHMYYNEVVRKSGGKDSKVKDSEYHQIDMTDPWGGTRSLIVKAFSFEEAKKKAEKFKPEWKFRAGYQASKDDVDWAERRGLYVDSVNDLTFNRMTEEAKKLKEELGMYARQAGSHKSTSIVPYKTRQSGPQVKELNEAINEAIQQLQNGVRDKSAWNRLAIKLEAWEDDPEMTSIAKRAAKAIRKFEVFIGDSDMKDIQLTKAPGTDKIIYVMQSDIDKNLYFYIGKTFSMKEGNWGYTKFEMGNTTPDELKSELARNGWHQVVNGPAKIIDASNEEWTVVEEENYKKANKPIGANDADVYDGQHEIVVNGKKYKPYYVESGLRNIILQSSGTYFVMPHDIYSKYVDTGIDISKYIILQTKSKSEALKIGLNTKDSLDMSNKKQLFTIEYEQDGVMHIRKVRANSIEDAISKVKDDKIAELRAQLKTMQQLFERAPMGFKRAEYKKEIDRLKLELKKLGYNE